MFSCSSSSVKSAADARISKRSVVLFSSISWYLGEHGERPSFSTHRALRLRVPFSRNSRVRKKKNGPTTSRSNREVGRRTGVSVCSQIIDHILSFRTCHTDIILWKEEKLAKGNNWSTELWLIQRELHLSVFSPLPRLRWRLRVIFLVRDWSLGHSIFRHLGQTCVRLRAVVCDARLSRMRGWATNPSLKSSDPPTLPRKETWTLEQPWVNHYIS